MNFLSAANLTAALFTNASGIQWLWMCLKRRCFLFPKITSKNPKVRGIIETFQKNMKSAYGNHIFTSNEISIIQNLVQENSKFVKVSEKEREDINEYIYKAIEDYNESIRKSLKNDHQVLLDTIESNFKEVKRGISNIENKDAKKKQNLPVANKVFPKQCQTLKKLGIPYPDEGVNTIFSRLKALPSNFRDIFYIFVVNSYDTNLKMQAPIFDGFVKEQGVSGVHALFEGPLSLLSSDDAEPHCYATISIKYEDSWNLILANVERKMWPQLIINVDFSLLD